MHIAIIGAGFSGITTAKTLRDLGHTCTVYEACADVGGVWSASRRYPGVQTQNTKETYCLSDMAMPSHYGEWPTGAEVQGYLEAYVRKNKLDDCIRLNARVREVKRKNDSDPLSDDATPWVVKTADGASEEADHIVVCTGIFSEVLVPKYDGQRAFEEQGGRVCHTSQLNYEASDVKGRDIVVVGYGKSACDVANAVAEDGVAAHTTLVARRLIWKVPRKIRGLTYKWLLLTRMGEALFEYMRPANAVEWLLHRTRVGKAVRNGLMDSLEWVIKGQLGLKGVGLVPSLAFETVAQSTISLSSEGLYDKVRRGAVRVKRDVRVVSLGPPRQSGKGGDKWGAHLSDGSFVPADVVVCGTGYEQKPPGFLPDAVSKRLVDHRGYWLLYRHIKPIDVPKLTFNGFGSSLFAATSSEASALWIGALLGRGEARMLPSRAEQRRRVDEKLQWLEVRCQGKHSNGTNVVPFSLHSIDEVLDEAGCNISAPLRLVQWLLPVNPTYYAGLSYKLARTLAVEAKADDMVAAAKKKLR